MRIPTLLYRSAKEVAVPFWQDGLNLTAAPKGMAVCRNMTVSNGVLQTRAGLETLTENPPALSVREYFLQPFRMTEVTVTDDGVDKRLGFDIIWDALSYVHIRPFWVCDNGAFESCGTIDLYRTTSEIFYLPTNVQFFSAGTDGKGIYALLQAQCEDNPEWLALFRCPDTPESWQQVNTNEFYVPTVYLNGRGNRYDFACGAGGVRRPAPRMPEQQNLLTGRFYAFYSTDTYSSRFQLPIADLDAAVVRCRLYTTPSEYIEWELGATQSTVAHAFGTGQVTFHCDRVSGMFWFTGAGGDDFPLPEMSGYNGNNLRITASHTVPGGEAAIYGATALTAFGDWLYAAGSSAAPGKICVARRDKPLYFPQGATATAGDDLRPITALRAVNGTVMAFKEKAIYRLDVSRAGMEISAETFADGEPVFLKKATLHARQIHPSVGCDLPETLAQVGNRLVWMNRDRTVYALSSSVNTGEKHTAVLSETVSPSLLAADADVGFCAMGDTENYLLFCGNRVWHYDGKRWCHWVLPATICVLTAWNDGDGWRLVYRFANSEKYLFAARFSGTDDRIYTMTGSGLAPKTEPILYAACSKELDFGTPDRRKVPQWLFLTGSAEQPFTVECGKRFRCPAKAGGGTYAVRPAIYGTDTVKVGICGSGKAAFTSARFRVRTLSEGKWQ